MTKTCINAKNYKLTVGKVYEIIEEEGDFYTLINDANKAVSYSSALFKNTPKEKPVKVAPPVPVPPPVVITHLEDVNITVNHNNNVYLHIVANNGTTVTSTISVSGSNSSCGIQEFNGVQAFTTSIAQCFNGIQNKDFTFDELLTVCFEKIFEELGENMTYLISVRNDYDHFETLSLVLTALSDTSISKVNPNSGHQITSWLL